MQSSLAGGHHHNPEVRCDDMSVAVVGSLRLCHAVLEVTAICGCTIIFLRLPTGPLASDLH